MTTTLELLDRLVAFDTVSHRSNLALIDHVQDFLAARGFAVTRVRDPEAPKAGLFARIGPGEGGVLLSAHSDVVPVEGQAWTRDPFRLGVEGDRLYGRGTTDMKGALAAMLALADAAAKRPLRAPLKLAISYDEEVGCVGIARMIDALVPAIGLPRACIVAEPTGLAVATGHKGKQVLRAVCHGEAGHSALAPRFVNALHLATDLVQRLRALQDELAATGARDEAYAIPFSTVHVGTLTGGRALNIVPDRAEIAFEVRHVAAEDPAGLVARIRTAAAGIAAAHGPPGRIEIETPNAYPGLDTAPEAEVVRMTRALAGAASTTRVAFGTEAGFFHRLGIPTVVCGPGSMEAEGHRPDESISRRELAAFDAMLSRLLDRLC
ncbi:MAG: acetylornithine deacetylase [Pseudomonadota bacterium]